MGHSLGERDLVSEKKSAQTERDTEPSGFAKVHLSNSKIYMLMCLFDYV